MYTLQHVPCVISTKTKEFRNSLPDLPDPTELVIMKKHETYIFQTLPNISSMR